MGRRKDDVREPTHFGKMLKYWREKMMYTQEELARRAGLAVSTVWKLEAGRHEPAWPEVLLLADALGKQVNDFEWRDGKGQDGA